MASLELLGLSSKTIAFQILLFSVFQHYLLAKMATVSLERHNETDRFTSTDADIQKPKGSSLLAAPASQAGQCYEALRSWL